MPASREEVISGLRNRAEQNLLLSSWKGIAARNGALTLYDFYRTQQLTNKLFPRCPTLFNHFDRAKLKEAFNSFEKVFKDFGAVRQGAAHRGEFGATPEKFAKHVSADPLLVDGSTFADGIPLFISGALFGRSYKFTVDGKHVSYDLCADSVAALHAIVETYADGLDPGAEFTMSLWRERQQKNDERPSAS